MDNTETEVVAETPLQVVKVKTVTVTYDRIVAGEVTDADRSVTVTVTPELVASLGLADAGLVEEGFNIVVE